MEGSELLMEKNRATNLVGMFALAIADRTRLATERVCGHVAGAPAAIVHIGTAPGQSIGSLRMVLGLTHSGTVRLVERLEAANLVVKERGQDGRVAVLDLTPAGRTLRTQILASRHEVLSQILADVTPGEWEALVGLIEKVMPRLTTSWEESEHICRLCDIDTCPQDRCPVEPVGGFSD